MSTAEMYAFENDDVKVPPLTTTWIIFFMFHLDEDIYQNCTVFTRIFLETTNKKIVLEKSAFPCGQGLSWKRFETDLKSLH